MLLLVSTHAGMAYVSACLQVPAWHQLHMLSPSNHVLQQLPLIGQSKVSILRASCSCLALLSISRSYSAASCKYTSHSLYIYWISGEYICAVPVGSTKRSHPIEHHGSVGIGPVQLGSVSILGMLSMTNCKRIKGPHGRQCFNPGQDTACPAIMAERQCSSTRLEPAYTSEARALLLECCMQMLPDGVAQRHLHLPQ